MVLALSNDSHARGFFVTGTDTGVGKTLVAALLAVGLRRRGLKVGTMKPVATGAVCFQDDSGSSTVVADDTRLLQQAAEPRQPLSLVTPCTFELPASPHLAARQAGMEVAKEKIVEAFRQIQDRFSVLIVEGIGGLLVPLRDDWMVADMAGCFGLPLIVVARSGLGTLNHTLLTLEVARVRNLEIAGVVINQTVPPEDRLSNTPWSIVEQDNIDTIRRLTSLPILGAIPHLPMIPPPACGGSQRGGGNDPAAIFAAAESHIDWGRVLSLVS